MSSTVTIDERQVLRAVYEYLERTEQSESAFALLENNSDDLKSLQEPKDLVILKKFCINGRWENVLECVNAFQESKGFKNCLYEVTKQWYLEVLSEKSVKFSRDSDIKLLRDLLLKIKQLCPSEREYLLLKSLVKISSPSANPEYSHWSLLSSRVRVYQLLANWLLNLNTEHSPRDNTSVLDTRLVKLLAKGLLYERCEAICLRRCRSEQKASSLEMFDLSAWMQQQPDSAYQISPSCCQLAFSRENSQQVSGVSVKRADTSDPVPTNTSTRVSAIMNKLSIDLSKTKSPSLSTHSQVPIASNAALPNEVSKTTSKAKPTLASHSVPIIHHLATDKKNMSQQKQSWTEQQGSYTAQADQKAEEIAENSPEERLPTKPCEDYNVEIALKSNEGAITEQGKHTPAPDLPTSDVSAAMVTAPDLVTVPQKIESDTQVREADSTHKIQVFEKFENNFTGTTPHILNGHLQVSSGRDSSTPKNPNTKPRLPPSPPASPVARPQTLAPQRQTSQSEQSSVKDVPRRCFEFSSKETSIEWPTATLLSEVKDTQAVRSVAFSQSGSVVAVGANSRTLRLCSTTPLLEGRKSEELPVLYEHVSYHKGSIYCLAWHGDTLLASGSNDHRIKLLSYDPTHSNTPIQILGELTIHSGTIRGLVFTPSGMLVSGGAVDTHIKITDCTTRQTVRSLPGHTQQVLAVDFVDENSILSAGQDKTIRLWDIRQSVPVWTLTSAHSVNSLSVCAIRGEVVSSQGDGSCSLHSLRGARTRATYHPHTDDCRCVCWSPAGGQWLLSGSYDGSVCLADPGSTDWVNVGQHSDKVVQAQWHPTAETQVFATTGADKRAAFWSLS